VSYSDLLINTCTIKRFTEGAADGYGNPVKAWADHLADEPCRLVAYTGRIIGQGGFELKVGAEVVVAENMIFFNDIDITEQDRVIIDSITYEVILVLFRQDAVGDHHKQVYVRTVR
jgi:hypothetical protein